MAMAWGSKKVWKQVLVAVVRTVNNIPRSTLKTLELLGFQVVER